MQILLFGTLTILFLLIFKHFSPKSIKTASSYLRGRKLISYKQAQKIALKLFKKTSSKIFFGGLSLPIQSTEHHFLVLGATGTGKTLTIRFFLQSILPKLKQSNSRIIIYDAKTDLIPILTSINPDASLNILHPFDNRGVSWDLAKDITDKPSAIQLAHALIPDENSYSPYFTETARHILSGIIQTLIYSKPDWTLFDIIQATKTTEIIKKTLISNPNTKYLVEVHFNNEKTISDVISTLSSKLQNFESIALAWQHSTNKLSLEDFFNSSSILILGESDRHKESLNAINRLIFTRLSEILLSQPENKNQKTYIILDEVRSLGRLTSLPQVFTKGRSKGACVVLGLQDIDGLNEIYGKNLANELLGQCGNIAILGLNSPDTATWASKLFGEIENLEQNISETTGKGNSSSISNTIQARQVILPSEFLSIPPISKKYGLVGYYCLKSIGAYKASISLNWINKNLIKSKIDIQEFEEKVISHNQDDSNFFTEIKQSNNKIIDLKNELNLIR